MQVDFDQADSDFKLARLAAEIVRDAVQRSGGTARWLADCPPVNTAGRAMVFPGSWDMAGSFPAIARVRGAAAPVSLRSAFGLPPALPAVRLPSAADLARQARSAPLIVRLEALGAWLGPAGRRVNHAGELPEADLADAARWLGEHGVHVRRADLRHLWEYALTSGWFTVAERAGGHARAVPGLTARRWAAGDDSGTAHVWAVVFASVLSAALELAASADQDAARKLNFRGQGPGVAMSLFLARRSGLSLAEVSELVRDGVVDGSSARRLRAWDAWLRENGDPALVLLGDLAALGAVTVAGAGSGAVSLTAPALWAMRELLRRDGIDVRLLPASLAQISAGDLVAMAEGVTEAEFDATCAAWVSGRGPEQAAHDLLDFAAAAGARERLAAVRLTRRIGVPAQLAWRKAMLRPELNGYARIALSAMAGELPDSTQPMVLVPEPDDLTWVATDLLALACGDADPDPRQVAAQFREAVPAGEEAWIFDLMARGSHPDVVRVLTVLGRRHPDRRVARHARRAAHAAARGREPVSARLGGH